MFLGCPGQKRVLQFHLYKAQAAKQPEALGISVQLLR